MSTRLHLGCGPGPQPDGWIHLDGSWNAWLAKTPGVRSVLGFLKLVPEEAIEHHWHSDIVVANLRRGLPFENGTFEAVYSSHVLEHLYEDEALNLLRESVRVLRPGGVLRMVVPDLQALALGYLEKKRAPASVSGPLPADWLNEMLKFRTRGRVRGFALHRLYSAVTDLHMHKWMYDAQSLASRMAAAGLRDVQERGLWESRIDRIEAIEKRDRIVDGAGVCVEGMTAIS